MNASDSTVPVLSLELLPIQEMKCSTGVGYAVINFNTAEQTIRCVQSLVQSDDPPAWVEVLDNASAPEDLKRLLDGLVPSPVTRIRLHVSDSNFGFAKGSNYLVGQLLREVECLYIGFLNNDAVAQPVLITVLRQVLEQQGLRTGMAGGRMHRLADPEEVDTLGITLYASLMPGDRKDTSDPYLGPTGGCCLMTRGFVEHILAVSGYFLDSRYFCYCEDTDLVLRANLLGYKPAYVDKLVALHEGQASSGGKYNNFIAYHGLRNAIWMQWKLVPKELMWRHGLWLCCAHVLTILRQILCGRGRLLFRVYTDAWRRRSEFVSENFAFARFRKLSSDELQSRMSPRFYRKGYAASVLLEIRSRLGVF